METMSAAATAAGYLYASGRLRGRSKETAEAEKPESPAQVKRRPVRIAGIQSEAYPQVQEPGNKPPVRARPAVRVEYRVRRWRPGEAA
jgi:hypothetical protein